MSSEHARVQRAIVAHFAGRITEKQERPMRTHLVDCEVCREYYNRHLALAQLDPTGDNPQTRLARGLGFAPQPSSQSQSFGWPIVIALAAACAVVVVAWPRHDLEPEFAARGGDGVPPARLVVYRVTQGEAPTQVVDQIRANDELAFGYENHAGRAYLMVFGRDEHGHTYWFYPAWTSAADNPTAPAIVPTDTLQELGEAIRHPFDGRELVIYGLFTNERLTPRDVEQRLKGGAPEDVLKAGGAQLESVRLQVVP